MDDWQHSSHRSFINANDWVGGRFRIVRCLGGELYEAEDRELGETVALRVFGPDSALSGPARAHLEKCVPLIRSVNHPNVCRVFDLGLCEIPGLGQSSFLSSEFLGGERLSAFLKRNGPLGSDAALPLVKQIVAGLAAAHHIGLLHGDLKSADVILVETKGESTPRVVLTGFGLAFPGEDDQTALGALLVEILGGRRPLVGESVASLRQELSGLERRWKKAILGCLAPNPAERFGKVEQVLEVLEAEEAPSYAGWPGLVAALFLAVAVSGAWSVYSTWGAEKPRKSIAILGLRNSSGAASDQWLSTGFVEILGAELRQAEQFRLLPSETVARAKTELGLEEQEIYSAGVLRRLAGSIQSDFVLSGMYEISGEPRQLRFALHVQDVGSGRVIQSVRRNGLEPEFVSLVSGMGRQVNEILAPGKIVAVQERRLIPFAAIRNYAMGLDLIRSFDPVGGREKLQQAVAADPDFAMAHAALADLYASLGFDAQSKMEARKAFDLATDLPRSDRLLIEARFREANRDWNGVERIYEALLQDYPDEPEYRLRLLIAMTKAGKGSAALAQVAKLPKGDARADLVEAAAAETINDFKRAGQVSRRAIADARRQGSLTAEARGWTLSGVSRFRLGDARGAKLDWERAAALYERLGDEVGHSRIYNNLGGLLLREGNLAGAKQHYEQSLAIKRKIGDQRGIGMTVGNLALLAKDRGNYLEALKLLEERLAIAAEMSDRAGLTFGWLNSAVMWQAQGEFEKAQESYEKAEAEARAMGARQDLGIVLMNKGLLSLDLGKVGEAGLYFDEAIRLEREAGAVLALPNMLVLKARWFLVRGQRKEAEALLAQANGFVKKSGNAKDRHAIDRVMAELWLEDGNAIEAERYLRLHSDSTDDQAMLVTALAQQNRNAEASSVADEVLADRSNLECRKCQWDVAIFTAPVRGAAVLRTALEEMRSHQAVLHEIRARRALAQVLRQQPNEAAARVEDQKASELARKSGFALYLVAR
ncbi:tetratricopeptide repeat protein [Bryobacter aggregatus]|uniref:tetratricopeptide repeat protein n=1 Tax=Bryobacter aggregatus TaxID=360054 RepID=UPI00138E4BA0|nr:tetratricopeptide repeat protein [Bryobacter aggregatus]